MTRLRCKLISTVTDYSSVNKRLNSPLSRPRHVRHVTQFMTTTLPGWASTQRRHMEPESISPIQRIISLAIQAYCHQREPTSTSPWLVRQISKWRLLQDYIEIPVLWFRQNWLTIHFNQLEMHQSTTPGHLMAEPVSTTLMIMDSSKFHSPSTVLIHWVISH